MLHHKTANYEGPLSQNCRLSSLSQISWRLSPVPSHKVHAYLDRQHFGKVYWKVHHGMDWPVYYMKRNHRIYFHDVLSVSLIAKKYYPGDSNAIRSGLLHLEIDDACTRNPAYHTQLEFFAELDIKQRKKQKRNGRQRTPKEFKDDVEFFRKILEIQRLDKAMRS